MMVGRDRELARVTLYLEDALAGHGRLVLCTGEAGVGKTRLAEEAAALAGARGVPVAWARVADRGVLRPRGPHRAVFVSGAALLATTYVFVANSTPSVPLGRLSDRPRPTSPSRGTRGGSTWASASNAPSMTSAPSSGTSCYLDLVSPSSS